MYIDPGVIKQNEEGKRRRRGGGTYIRGAETRRTKVMNTRWTGYYDGAHDPANSHDLVQCENKGNNRVLPPICTCAATQRGEETATVIHANCITKSRCLTDGSSKPFIQTSCHSAGSSSWIVDFAKLLTSRVFHFIHQIDPCWKVSKSAVTHRTGVITSSSSTFIIKKENLARRNSLQNKRDDMYSISFFSTESSF